MTHADQVELTEAGLGPRAIMAKLETSAAFDTSLAALVAPARVGMIDDATVAAQGRVGRDAGGAAPDPAIARYAGAPSDGSAWLQGGCSRGVLRGGAWSFGPRPLRAATRFSGSGGAYYNTGFRVARTVMPVTAAMAAVDGTDAAAPTTGTSGPATDRPPADPGASSALAWPQPRAIPGNTFRESLRGGGEGPEMVVIPAGRFRMGCLSDEFCPDGDGPVHEVRIARPFALSVHEATFEDYDRFTYPNKVDDLGSGRGRRPVIKVSWNDAQDYVAWLSAQTGAEYRLPSEAEWEYAARAGTETHYSWGDDVGVNRANCMEPPLPGGGCGDRFERRAPVGSFAPNAWGLYDMHGNMYEWTEDCWNGSYAGAPSDGSAWLEGDCSSRVLRGGSWFYFHVALRASHRHFSSGDRGDVQIGFRVARTLTP